MRSRARNMEPSWEEDALPDGEDGASEPFTPNCIVQPGDGPERIDWFTHVRLYTRSGVALAAGRRGCELGVAREREMAVRQPEQFMSHTATIVHVMTPGGSSARRVGNIQNSLPCYRICTP
jgi:hypothetical protein